MNRKSILIETVTAAALGTAGIVAINNTPGENSTAQAAVVGNTEGVYTATKSTVVYADYNGSKKTGQVLPANTEWKIIKTAYDKQGNKWYDLGKNQWVKAEEVRSNRQTQTTSSASTYTTSQPQVQAQTQTSSSYSSSSAQSSTQSAQPVQSSSSKTSYTSSATGSEASAKAWIAGRESGGSYSARNGQYIGKYQLSASYLGGDYSAANQEKAADNYVKSRYGSWNAAKSFWQANGWY